MLTAGTAFATNVGDTYQQVIAEKGAPTDHLEAGSMKLLTYPDTIIKLRDDKVTAIKPTDASPRPAAPVKTAPAASVSEESRITALKAQLDDAVTKAKRIINQPVTPLPKDPNRQFWEFYFHDGALRPNFSEVDVRKTQENSYVSHGYILWKGSPDVMWDGSELEFNSMTKIFYEDRTVPKKKLTEAEMVEINRLYRVIGSTEQQLAALGYKGPVP